MYWFLYKKFNSNRWIVYNGDKANLKHTIDPLEAQEWYDKVWNKFKTVKVTRLDWSVNLDFPFVEEWEEEEWLGEYLNKSNISLSMQQFMHWFLNQFIFTKELCFRERYKWVSEDQDKIGTLLSMRNMIEWLIRWEPIKVDVWVDKKTNTPKYSNWYIHQHFGATNEPNQEEIDNNCYVPQMFSLETSEWERKIPIMWAYAQKLLAAIFPRPQFNGRRLQIRQQRFLLERGQQTVVLAPREWGKSLIAAYLAFVYLMKQYTDYDDETRWITIHYFWLSDEQLDTVANYVVGMVSKMIENKKAIKYNKTDKEVIFNDWWNLAKLKLMSQLSYSKGRWERPSIVIIDEAGYTDEEVHKIAQGTAGIPIVMITTVNYGTKRNWAYDLALEWLAQQRNYDSIEETITKIFFKYQLDKVTTIEQLEKMYEDRVFRKMRDELYYARPLVTLKFTIDDRENITPQQKELTLAAARKKWEKFLAAEHYSEYVEELTLFNSDGFFEQEMPDKYDFWFLATDPAEKGDDYALCFWWYKNWLLYIENSISLNDDPVERIKELRHYENEYRRKCRRFITLADITQAEAQIQLLEERWFDIDIPVKWTNWWSINYDWKTHKVWKKVAVMDVTKEIFFDRWIIRFNTTLIWEWSLSDEMQNYTINNQGKYAASKWKDDKVSAMMLVCYGCYVTIIQWELLWERYLWYDPEEIEMIKEAEEMEARQLNDYYSKRENAIDMGLL